MAKQARHSVSVNDAISGGIKISGINNGIMAGVLRNRRRNEEHEKK